MTSYPPPPWILRGRALAVPFLAPARRARPPAPLEPLSAAGRVPALLVAARYGPGSTLEYDECALLVAVRSGLRPGVHVPWLRVDDPASVRGGREVWRLPKELAQFHWKEDAGRVAVRVLGPDGGGLVEARAAPAGPAVRAPLPVPLRAYGSAAGRVETFRTRVRGRFRPARLETLRLEPGITPGRLRTLGFGWIVEELEAAVEAPRPGE